MHNMPDEMVLRLTSVSRSFGDYIALHPTSIEVRKGEFFSLLGPSGCGKTTTLRVIAGFETPDTGEVWLDGKDITHAPAHLRDTNTVFQSYALFPHMTVAENVAYPLMVKGRKEGLDAKVNEAVARVNMTEFKSRLPHEMSGGQRQRIALARAIISEPKVLLLDEPLGALDLKLREQMQHVLVGLQKELGITFIYVTHDQGEALSMSDRIAVMKSGRVQQIGTPDEIYYQPGNAFVAGFIGKSNILNFAASKNGNRTVLCVGALRFPAPAHHTSSAALRYEALKIGDTAGLDVIGTSTVVDALFFGSTLEVTLDVGGQRLLATVPAKQGVRPQPGQSLAFGFNLQDMVFLHD